MTKRRVLMALTGAMSVYMLYVAVDTSRKSNLFDEWNALSQIPWMTATLKDFYQNILLIWLWVLYKEDALWKSLIWLVLFIVGGSITTSAYVFWQLYRLKPGEPVERILLRG